MIIPSFDLISPLSPLICGGPSGEIQMQKYSFQRFSIFGRIDVPICIYPEAYNEFSQGTSLYASQFPI